MTYLEECTKYFAPLDEIEDALNNDEGISGISNEELKCMIKFNAELRSDLNRSIQTRSEMNRWGIDNESRN